MEKTLQIPPHKILLFILGAFFFISCNDTITFSKYQTFPEAIWEANKKIDFQFSIQDTVKPYDLFIHLRNNDEYAYSNLYLITELTFPDEKKIIDTLQYAMTNKAGDFLGTGFSTIKENKLFYKQQKIFPISGTYSFSVTQAMRAIGDVNPLPFLGGVMDVGFSIEK